MAGNPNNVRLGHALRMSNDAWNNGRDLTEITKEAFRYAIGKEKLVARAPAPQYKAAVEHAENQIGIDPHDPARPVYAYIGDLHASLGQVGLVFDRGWARRCLHGFTQCDSGGMGGGFGNFKYASNPDGATATQEERDRAVRSITVLRARDPGVVATLDATFAKEVASSYADGAHDYVYSVKPNVEAWTAAHEQLRGKNNLTDGQADKGDPRVACVGAVDQKKEDHDRRIWTWEVRMSESPKPDELVAVILSPEASKVFLSERLDEAHEIDVMTSLRDVRAPEAVVSVQIRPPHTEALNDVELVMAAANAGTQKQSGKTEHTDSAPWFYSDRARDVLLGPP